MQYILKLNWVWLALTILTISSCKKKDEQTPTKSSIVGTWTVKSYVITNFENGGKDINDTKNHFPRPYLEFKEDGTCINAIETKPETIGYTIVGNQVKFTTTIAFEHNSFDYSINGSIMTFKRTDILTLTANTTYTEKTTITLEKQ